MENNFTYAFIWGLFAFSMGLGIGMVAGMFQMYRIIRKTWQQLQKEYTDALHKIERT